MKETYFTTKFNASDVTCWLLNPLLLTSASDTYLGTEIDEYLQYNFKNVDIPFQMNDFMRDKFTSDHGKIPLYGEMLAGATVR